MTPGLGVLEMPTPTLDPLLSLKALKTPQASETDKAVQTSCQQITDDDRIAEITVRTRLLIS
jgi:hypothetical protein